MGTVLNSYDTLLSQNSAQGPIVRCISGLFVSPSAATVNCGYNTLARAALQFTVPSYGGAVSNTYMTWCRAVTNQNLGAIVVALEYNLGNINMSTGTFTAGVTMPTKTIEGSSIQTSSMLTVAVVTSAITATTPLVTATYTDQDGNTGNSCAMTLPSAAGLNSGFVMTPHLASGDTGVRAVTACTKSAGSAGTLTFFGLLPLAFNLNATANVGCTSDPLATPWPMFPIAAGETLGFYNFNSSAVDFHLMFALQPDN